MKKPLLTLILSSVCILLFGQKPNIAPAASVTCTGLQTLYPPSTLNDLNFGTCGSQQFWMSSSSGSITDYIEWTWTLPQSFDEITFHQADNVPSRQLVGGVLQSWDGSQWVNEHTFANLPLACDNNITFTRITTTKLRMTQMVIGAPGATQFTNVNFREIEIFKASSAPNDAGIGTIQPLTAVCAASSPVQISVQNYGTNQIDSVRIGWEVNGIGQPSVLFNSAILDTIGGLGSSNAVVTLGNYNFATNTNYAVEAWTFLPNNAVDTTTYNDTVMAILRLEEPGGFAVYNVRATTADVSWTATGATGYRVVYGLLGFDPQVSGSVANFASSPGALTALTPNTAYEAYLIADCGLGSFSDTAGPEAFLTECQVFSAPFIENFDGASWVKGNSSGGNDDIDPCWFRNSNALSYKWSVWDAITGSTNTGPDQDHTGGNYLFTESSYTTPLVAELVSPRIDVSNLTVPYLSFYYHRYGTPTTMGDMEVAIDDGSGWVTVQTFTGTEQTAGTDPFTEWGMDISSFGDSVKVRFSSFPKACCAGDMAIDLFQIKEAPSCPKLTGLDTIQVGDVSATLTWNTSSKATQYQVWYGPQGFFQGTATTGGIKVLAPTNSPTLTSLNSQFCYDYLVRAICTPGDSSDWVGPFSFCTDLGYDAELVALLVPDGCGSASSEVSAVIRNNGDNPISNFPISVTLTGTANGTYSTTYTNTLATNDVDTVVMTTLNTLKGGLISYFAYVNLATDQITANDTIQMDSVYTIPQDPLANDTAFCTNQDTALLLAFPVPAVSYNWFDNATSQTPIFKGNPLKVPTATAQSTYYVEYSNDVGSLTTQFNGNTTCAGGNMFDLQAINTVSITGFDLHFSVAGPNKVVDVYYIPNNTWSSSPTVQSAWTSAGSYTVNSNGPLTGTPLSLNAPITIAAGQTFAFYILFEARYTSTSINAQNADLKFIAGNGNCTPFDNCCIPRTFDGTIYYGAPACSNTRMPVNLAIGSDTSIAAFTSSWGGGGTMNFDASASVNADHYAWDFGDGTFGTGNSTTHNYATTGNFTVVLTVSDSTDCYSSAQADSTFFIGIGLMENSLARDLLVYPNPTTSKLLIELESANSKQLRIELKDVSGKELMSIEAVSKNGIFKEELALTNLAKGVYLLEVTDGQLRVRKRVLKQ